VTAMPGGCRRAKMAPMIPTASTPKYIRLAGSLSAPMMPTLRLSQTRINTAASARPMADR
jgi:hypothetical protein